MASGRPYWEYMRVYFELTKFPQLPFPSPREKLPIAVTVWGQLVVTGGRATWERSSFKGCIRCFCQDQGFSFSSQCTFFQLKRTNLIVPRLSLRFGIIQDKVCVFKIIFEACSVGCERKKYSWMQMPSAYAEGNCCKCNRSLASTKNREKEKRNLLHPTTYFWAIYSPTRGVFIFTLLSQQDLQTKAEWDHRNAGSIYSWKTFVGNILQRERKKDPMGDVLDWTVFYFHQALHAARPSW